MSFPYPAEAFDDRRVAYLERRIRRLPAMLENARRKVAALETEARRYGMDELA